MKKTRKKKQVCCAACFMADEITFSKDVRLQTKFPELFEKTIGSIHFIPGIYPSGVSLLTPIHFRVPSLIFGPLVAKYLAEMGFPECFEKTIPFITYLACLNSSGTKFSWRIPTCVAHNCKIEIIFGYFWMRWVVNRAGVYCPHLWAQLVILGESWW